MLARLRTPPIDHSVLCFTCKFLGFLGPTVQLSHYPHFSGHALWFSSCPLRSTGNKAEAGEVRLVPIKNVYDSLEQDRLKLKVPLFLQLEHQNPSPITVYAFERAPCFLPMLWPTGKIFYLSKGFFHKQVILFKWVPLAVFINMKSHLRKASFVTGNKVEQALSHALT